MEEDPQKIQHSEMLMANLRKQTERIFLCGEKENSYSPTLKSLKKLSGEVGNITGCHRVSASPHRSPLSAGTLSHTAFPSAWEDSVKALGVREPGREPGLVVR